MEFDINKEMMKLEKFLYCLNDARKFGRLFSRKVGNACCELMYQ